MNDYKEYLEAKKVVELYEKDFRITWICNKTLYMEGTKIVAFTKGNEYKQIRRNVISAIDDRDDEHSFGGAWEKYFTTIKLTDDKNEISLICPNENCGSDHIATSTQKGFLQGYCFDCSNIWGI